MKILVTGGAGFIGSHIVDAYIDLGHDVFIIDNLSSGKKKHINPKAYFYHIDILNKIEIDKIIDNVKPEIINYHAAQISVRNSVKDPINDSQINILGFLNLMEAGRKNGLKKVIFASSGGVVYGDAKKIPTPEDYVPLQPMSPYGITKLCTEYYLNFYKQSYGITYTALRYSNIFGPRQSPHGEAGVVAIFSLKLLKGVSPKINGSGTQTRDYLYVKDVVSANVIALNPEIEGSYNIGTGIETDVNQIYDSLRKIIKTEINAIYGPPKIGEQERSCLDASLALKIMRWSPQTNLHEGLRQTVAYFQNNE